MAGRWLLTAGALLISLPAAALEKWNLQGSNELRYEYYDSSGNSGGSIYRDTGGDVWNSLYLFFNGNNGPYDRWRGDASLLFNDSEYRARDDGIVPERLHLQRENGEGLPYRLDVGDFFAFTSYRSLQRSLKGLQWETQPPGTSGSLQLFAGFNQPEWRRIDEEQDLFAGGSWLMNLGNGGAALNLIYNDREANPLLGITESSQWLASVAAEQRIEALPMQIEGELAWIDGDNVSPTGTDGSDTGLFLQLSSPSGWQFAGRPWYRLRFERYGENYRPAGAIVTGDRRSIEALGGGRILGIDLRLRVQNFRDALQSGNPLDTRIYGYTLSGTAWDTLQSTLDVYRQEREDRSGALDASANVVNLDLSHTLSPIWRTRFGVYGVNNEVAGAPETDILEFRLGGDLSHELARGAFLLVSPGLTWRRLGGGTASGTELGPTLTFSLAGSRHELNLYAGHLRQDRDNIPLSDVDTLTTSADYRYRIGNHSLGLEYDSHHRDPQALGSTTDERFSVYWRWDFSLRGGARSTSAGSLPSLLPAGGPLSLAALTPGISLADATTQILEAGGGAGQRSGPWLIHDLRLLEEIDQRQRLVLEERAGLLRRSALLIGFDSGGRPDGMAEEFERVRDLLIRLYGTPDRFLERGDFAPGLAGELAAGRFLRVMEWDLESGVLRFGIPHQLDGELRMEIHHAAEHGSLRNPRWGLQAVR